MPTSGAFAANPESRSASRRAQLLADRIEKGADELIAYVQGLSDEQWRKPISATDQRTVGVIVHHVGFVYPIEVDAAKKIGSGEALPVTWADIAQLNAGHAGDNANVTKAEAIEFMKKNNRAAAAAVRQFTDEELDTAAPFGLSYGAPVTAQFVIEDHALRHAWHHLAKIKQALENA
jgi:hypothetical protein